LYGHAIGILCGYGSLLLLGLQHAGSELGGGTSLRRLVAVALSLGATAFFMILLKVAHAPAGATTLIVSMGLITQPFDLLVIEMAVVLLCVQSVLFNRFAGLDYPVWAGPIDSAMEVMSARFGRFELREKQEDIRPQP
jgi:CBS-domain-containing membrane protein